MTEHYPNRELLEQEIGYLSSSIRQKMADLERTKRLHAQAVRKLAVISTGNVVSLYQQEYEAIDQYNVVE